MQEEISSLETTQTRAFRVKEEHDGSKRYKAKLVAEGFQQKRGIDYNDIFTLVVKMTTIRLVLRIVAIEDLHLEQLDVKTTFLHSDFDEDICMVQLEGFQIVGEENLVCKLSKGPYVNDMLVAGSKIYEINILKIQLSKEFEM